MNYKSCFFSFFFILTPLTFKSHNFLIHFKWFKMLQEHYMKFYKASLNSNINRATYKEFFGWSETGLVVFSGLFFWVLLTLSTLGGCNFLNFILFSMIFSTSDAPIGRVQVLFGNQRRPSFPLGSSLPWAFKCSVTSQFTLKNTKTFSSVSGGCLSHFIWCMWRAPLTLD